MGVASGRDVSVGDITVEANGGRVGLRRVRDVGPGPGDPCGVHRRVPAAASTRSGGTCIVIERAPRAVPGLRLRAHGTGAWPPGGLGGRGALSRSPDQRHCMREFRRKIRTMARGLATLWYKRHLLDPVRYGLFAWMLWSHKLIRWLVFLAAPLALVALALLSLTFAWRRGSWCSWRWLESVSGSVAMRAPEGGSCPRLVALCGFVAGDPRSGSLGLEASLPAGAGRDLGADTTAGVGLREGQRDARERTGSRDRRRNCSIATAVPDLPATRFEQDDRDRLEHDPRCPPRRSGGGGTRDRTAPCAARRRGRYRTAD